LLFSRQEELRFCQSQHKTHKKLLSSTNNFYLYLLKRLSQVGDGIKHLKIVGTRLRSNLVTAQTMLGQCKGSLQGLRHECQALVNWYQSIPGRN